MKPQILNSALCSYQDAVHARGSERWGRKGSELEAVNFSGFSQELGKNWVTGTNLRQPPALYSCEICTQDEERGGLDDK